MEDRSPVVTIGLPVYNGERFLGEAMESLLAQDFTDFELLVADNGSSDRTEEIARSYLATDDRVRYHRSPVNRGAAWNYNRVFQLSRGRYFKWAAHDDVYAPGFLSACVRVLDERPEVSLCSTGAVDIDAEGTVLKTYPPLPYGREREPHERVRKVILNPSPCFESFALMRREQMAETELIGAYTSSDRTLILELAMHGQFEEVPEPLFFHRQHPGRSMFRYPTARGRNEWFDPARAGRFTYPRWRLLVEYLRAIRRAPIGPGEQLRCGRHLLRWTAKNSDDLAREIAARLKAPPGVRSSGSIHRLVA